MPLDFAGDTGFSPGMQDNINGAMQRTRVKALTQAYVTDPRAVSPGLVLRAFHPREIQLVLYVNGEYMYFPVDELSWNTTEQLIKHHGTGKAEGFSLIGGDIDHSGSFGLVSFVGNDSRVDTLRYLLRKGKDHRAVYFVIEVNLVDYEGEHSGSGGQIAGIGGTFGEDEYLPLIQLQWAKVKDNGVTINSGSAVKTKWSFDYLTEMDLV